MKAYRLRKLQDVVFLGLHTMLVLEIRLFRCVNKDCEKKSFREPLKLAKPYVRMTTAEQRKALDCSREMAAIVAGGTISIQAVVNKMKGKLVCRSARTVV